MEILRIGQLRTDKIITMICQLLNLSTMFLVALERTFSFFVVSEQNKSRTLLRQRERESRV